MAVTALISGLIGFGFGEARSWRIDSKDRHRAIGRALSDLLEVWHLLRTTNSFTKALREQLALPPQVLRPAVTMILEFLPTDPELPKRYEEAMILLAGDNPLMAHRLRRIANIPEVLGRIQKLANDSNDLVTFEMLDQMRETDMLEALEESLTTLSTEHDKSTKTEMAKALATPLDLSKMDEIVEKVKAVLSQTPTTLADPAKRP
ncbi:MAG TPA: hypothetical protein VGM77_11090 [Gemmatimonadales bacterium]